MIALKGQGRAYMRAGGKTHVTKAGKVAKKGLWYNIAQKKKRGEKMRKKGAKGAPTEKAIQRSQLKDGGSAAWTRKEGKNPSGGLNAKGRASYKAQTGGTLKAPSKKVGNPRRKSFCARMTGMRKRQKPSNNTGDDRLSKSLRAWNC